MDFLSGLVDLFTSAISKGAQSFIPKLFEGAAGYGVNAILQKAFGSDEGERGQQQAPVQAQLPQPTEGAGAPPPTKVPFTAPHQYYAGAPGEGGVFDPDQALQQFTKNVTGFTDAGQRGKPNLQNIMDQLSSLRGGNLQDTSGLAFSDPNRVRAFNDSIMRLLGTSGGAIGGHNPAQSAYRRLEGLLKAP